MTDTSVPPGDDQFLAAEYVLGLLGGQERRSFAQKLSTDRAAAQEVRFWEERFMPLIKQVASVTPPGAILQKIENRLFPASAAKPSFWQSLALWRGLSFASLAAFAVVAMLYARHVPFLQTNTQSYVATVAAPGDAVKLVAYYDSASNLLKFNRVAGAAVSGRSLQLWLIAGSDAPVSLGVLPDAQNGAIAVADVLRPKLSAAVLAISDEPQGGSPTGQPTGAVLATGKLETL